MFFKKTLTFLCIFALLSFPVSGYESEQSEFLRIGNILSNNNIIIGLERIQPEDHPLRDEFTAAALRLLEQKSVDDYPTRTVFSDVPESHWFNPFAVRAKELGFIRGNGDGTSRPDEYITQEEAVTILVSLLGYEEHAKKNGSYPTGYAFMAKQLGIIDKTTEITNDFSTYNEIFPMLLKTMRLPLCQQSETLWEKKGYPKAEGMVQKLESSTYEWGDTLVFLPNKMKEPISLIVSSTYSDYVKLFEGKQVVVFYSKTKEGEKFLIDMALVNK